MGRKPKAGGADGKRTDPEQFARFLEAAREAGVDDTGEVFERAFEKVVQSLPSRPGGDPAKRDTRKKK